MPAVTLPYTFTDGVSTIDAVTTNANNNAMVAGINAVDHTQIGAGGIYASQIIPTTTGQATFGGVTAGVGYTFSAPDATATPLTVTSAASASVATLSVKMGSSQSVAGLLVSGASSITGNIVEADLTSGGTVAMALTSAGVLNIGSQTVQSTTAGDLQVGQGNSAGRIYFGGATHAGVLDYGISTGQQFTLFNNGASTGTLNVGKTGSYGNGSIAIGSNSSYSILQSTSGTVSGTTVAGTLTGFYAGASLEAAISSGGNLGIAGTLQSSSSIARKKNIEDAPHDALSAILSVKPVRYNFIEEKEGDYKHLGFIAEHVDPILTVNGTAVDPYSLSVSIMVALQQLYAKLRAAGIAV